MKVYLSSTFEDLKREREAAYEAIRGLGHDAVAMEDYGAEGRRPIGRCLEDVRACDAYVGLFGLHYGSKPDGHGGKSFTHLEYEEARLCGIDRYIFFKGGSEWDPRWIDEDRRDVNRLRAELETEHLVATFKSCDDLRFRVAQALARRDEPAPPARHTGPTSTRKDVPHLLPYLANRTRQEVQLHEALQRTDRNGGRRPLVCIIHGDEAQCHDMFVERLKGHSLSSILGLPPESAVLSHHLPWPADFRDPAEFARSLQFLLAKQFLKRTTTAELDEIARAVGSHAGPRLIHTCLDTETWMAGGAAIMEAFLEFWGRWPSLPTDRWLVVCLSFTYKTRHLGFFERRRLARLNEQVRSLLGPPCRLRYPEGVTLVVLDELAAVRRQEALDWARGEEVATFCGAGGRLVAHVEALYGEPEHRRAGGIAMEVLGTRLRSLLEQNAAYC